jgi:hypothetical protein
MFIGDEQIIVLRDNKGMLIENTPKESYGNMKEEEELTHEGCNDQNA